MNDKKPTLTILPETNDSTLCVRLEGIISDVNYDIVTANLEKIIEKQGQANFLVYFQSYTGWEEEAVAKDMDFSLQFGGNIRKMALVNPPEKIIYLMKSKGDVLTENVRYFEEADYDKAITWINE